MKSPFLEVEIYCKLISRNYIVVEDFFWFFHTVCGLLVIEQTLQFMNSLKIRVVSFRQISVKPSYSTQISPKNQIFVCSQNFTEGIENEMFFLLLLKIRFKCKRKKALKEITKNALLRQIRKELFQKCQNKRATVASILEKFLLVPSLIKQETDISKKSFSSTSLWYLWLLYAHRILSLSDLTFWFSK